MFKSNLQGKRVPGTFPGSNAGDTLTGVSYGDDGPCPNCGQRHTINETQQVYDVARTLVRSLPVVGGAMMLGVLRSADNQWFAACSAHDGTAGHNSLTVSAAAHKKSLPTLRVLGAVPARGVSTRSGAQLPTAEVRACSVDGHPIAGRCAAPKLLHYAIANNLRRPWSLSEVFYDPAKGNLDYSGWVTAESCLSCRKLLPLILCKHPNKDINLVQYTGMMRAVGWQ